MAYLGDTLMKAGRAADAKEILAKALRLDNDLRIAHFDLGIIEADDKNYAGAVKQFQEAIRVDPERSEAHYRLARIYQQMGRPADAAPEFALVKKLQEKKEVEPPVRLRRSQ
jgi:tetratricopeptide (TPR) repeat protein